MSLDFFSGLTERRQAPRFILLTIILMTLPCYCLGAILLATAPDRNESKAEVDSTISTLSVSTSSPEGTRTTSTPFRTFTPIGQPLRPTSTQLYLRTSAPVYPTWTSIPIVTVAPPPTSTTAPTLTPLPTNAPIPTNTLPPSETPTTVPTNTDVPTEVPAATEVPVSTDVPVDTDGGGAVQEEASPTQETSGT